MTIETRALVRTFRYNSVDLPDPGAQYSTEEVRDLYAATYPEITSAAIEGPEEADGKLQYTFRRAVGTKGRVDLRPTLEAIAAGKSVGASGPVVSTDLVAEHHSAFGAWYRFVYSRSGESLAAPAELLTPLP